MLAINDYQLLDFGAGRRLERFGPITLDRPCPAAEAFQPATPEAWVQADARFDDRQQQRGHWTTRRELPERWTIAHDTLRFELKRSDFGHLGLFPEQATNWDWIGEQVAIATKNSRELTAPGARANSSSSNTESSTSNGPHPRPLSRRERGAKLKVLNLFAYTGGSTLAAAAVGAEVVHVDAAKNVVAWGRRNAELSGLADAPIRWIAEDALKFVKRELNRGSHYDAVILDPPSYGHGPKGEVWQLSKHLPELLSLCAKLTAQRLQFLLMTCHTPGCDAQVLSDLLIERVFTRPSGWMKSEPLTIGTADGRELPSGVVVRWRRTAKA